MLLSRERYWLPGGAGEYFWALSSWKDALLPFSLYAAISSLARHASAEAWQTQCCTAILLLDFFSVQIIFRNLV